MKYCIELSRAEKFESFLRNKGIEILEAKDGREWEAFRINHNGTASIFFAFQSTKTLESYDAQGQELIKEFLAGGVKFPIHA